MLYMELAYACMAYLASATPNKSAPPFFQFLHTVSAQYTGQVPSMVTNEGLWLSAHGRLPGTLRYVPLSMDVLGRELTLDAK